MTESSEHSWASARVFLEPLGASRGQTNLFVQLKNTSICFDFHCACGWEGHFDGYFAHEVKCPRCEAVFILPATIYPLPATEARELFRHTPVIPEGDDPRHDLLDDADKLRAFEPTGLFEEIPDQ